MKETTFDDAIYDREMEYSRRDEKTLNDLVSELKGQELPVTLAFISEITESEQSWGTWINKEYEKRIATGFVPIDEKKRVSAIYHTLFEQLNGLVARAIPIRKKELLTEKKGVCCFNAKRADEMARERATIAYDVDKMKEYWQEMKLFLSAYTRLKQFEVKNNLPPSTEVSYSHTPAGAIPIPPRSFTFGKNPTEENFQELFGAIFKKQ